MSRDELVHSYLEGQLSRRVFVRRLMASGVSAMAALAYVDILRQAPASAGSLTVGDFYILVKDYAFLHSGSGAAKVARGRAVRFNFSSTGNTHNHSATGSPQLSLFDTGFRAPGTSRRVDRFVAAGTYTYVCAEVGHPAMTGTIQVPLTVKPKQGPLGDSFKIIWASDTLSKFVFDVQRKRPGDASFQPWKTGVTKRSATFTPNATGTYRFRARLRRVSNGATSGWSVTKTLKVT
jgi:plastocyanin